MKFYDLIRKVWSMEDSVKKIMEETCFGCNWRCSGQSIDLHRKVIRTCPCSICIVKIGCSDICERWTEWADKNLRNINSK